MSKVQDFALEAAGKLLLDKQLWADVKVFVSDIDEQQHLTNEEKHATVMHNLRIIFEDIGNTILNLAIALAVAWVRNQQK